MRDKVRELIQEHLKRRTKIEPSAEDFDLCGSCAAARDLRELPKGVDIALSKEKLPDFGGQSLDSNWGVIQQDVLLGDVWLTMRFTQKLNHLEDGNYPTRGLYRGGLLYPQKEFELATSGNILSIYVDGFLGCFNSSTVYTTTYGEISPALRFGEYEEICGYIKANLKGKYVITILNLENPNMYCDRWLKDIANDAEKVYVSPLFNNRGHNNPQDYLTLTVYKF